ncbi:MAG: nicotinate-nucleotide--dimethylbenzimidazole phosphoribosyltransferase [Verrucomicrobia bacterium]|nr:nicotinate-nucleotide--dimethylbenzimidazole phosphoribosyltransferase [Verrucomicrobiota bacterium]
MNTASVALEPNGSPAASETGPFFEAARQRIDAKTKPRGSLGKLETIAVRLAWIQQDLMPQVRRKRVCVFAASHGIAAAGVSAYPPEVTGQMVLNFLAGGAAINVLARHGGIEVHVVDTGVDADWPETVLARPDFFVRRSRRGTRNFLEGRAMTPAECEGALQAGREQARLAVADGIQLLGIGDMGIGNTTAASALFAALLGLDAREVVGRGTGVSAAGVERKAEAVTCALRKHAPDAVVPRDWLEAVGGYEIAAMAGTILEAAAHRLPTVIDGFIATASAAAAFSIEPACRDFCFFAHRSDERAHGAVLAALGADPLLDLGLRLGEGTGAALAMHLIEAAAKVIGEMATFESAGVSGPAELLRNE